MAKAKRAAKKKKGGGLWFGVVVLIVGILYLIGDLHIIKDWYFFGISSWTAFFILAGIMLLFVHK